MAVRSDGDHWIMEQIGEKQDFESELSRLGLRHEDFELYVRRATFNGTRKVWSTNYAVRVSNSVTGKRNIYWGGPGQDWIAQFVKDVRAGLFGALFPARKPRAAAKPSQPPRRSGAPTIRFQSSARGRPRDLYAARYRPTTRVRHERAVRESHPPWAPQPDRIRRRRLVHRRPRSLRRGLLSRGGPGVAQRGCSPKTRRHGTNRVCSDHSALRKTGGQTRDQVGMVGSRKLIVACGPSEREASPQGGARVTPPGIYQHICSERLGDAAP